MNVDTVISEVSLPAPIFCLLIIEAKTEHIFPTLGSTMESPDFVVKAFFSPGNLRQPVFNWVC